MVDYADVEVSVRAAGDVGDWDRAATLVIRHYGSDILGYLALLSRNTDETEESFAEFSEALWKGLPRFEWRSSLRTWLYTIARNSFLRLRRSPARKRERQLGSSTARKLAEEFVEGSRRLIESERERALSDLRQELDEDEKTLLLLRVDQNLDWLEIAEVFYGSDLPSDDAEREKYRARLRKRYQRIKAKIRELARSRGLLE